MPPQPHNADPFAWKMKLPTIRKLTWKLERVCSYCKVPLLNTERPGWCCKDGRHVHRPLPALPFELQQLAQYDNASASSRLLNLVFSLASMETGGSFGHEGGGHPGFFVAGGKIYHRVRPSKDTATHWLLYDGFLPHMAPHRRWADTLPPPWIQLVIAALTRVNPFIPKLKNLAEVAKNHPEAQVVLADTGMFTCMSSTRVL